MTKYYSPSTPGFYDDSIHSNIPMDAIILSDDAYQTLLSETYNGKIIHVDENNILTTIDTPVPGITWDDIKRKRDILLSQSDYTQLPDYQGNHGSMSEWATYRQSLREIPQKYSDPNSVIWPTVPGA